jgi:hypothetical protein
MASPRPAAATSSAVCLPIRVPNASGLRSRESNRDRKAWIESEIELGKAMADARAGFKSNGAFSKWLKENNLDVFDRNERTALIGIGNNAGIAREVMEKSTRKSVRTIWEQDIKRHLSSQNVKTFDPEAYLARENDTTRAGLKISCDAILAGFGRVAKNKPVFHDILLKLNDRYQIKDALDEALSARKPEVA